MTLRNTSDHWGRVSRMLHWLIVLLILFQATTGLLSDELPRGTMTWHKSVGITVLVLAALRLVWRWYAGAPKPVPGTPGWQARLASAMHVLLYGLMLWVPVSGWIVADSGRRALAWFGLPMPSFFEADPALHERFEGLHETGFYLLATVAALHALAALYHHMFLRDRTLVRMWRG